MIPRSSQLLRAALQAMRFTRIDAAFAPVARGAGAILMLHNVRPFERRDFAPNRILEITPEFLETVIGLVDEAGFEAISLDDAYRRMTGELQSDRPFVCFTFDDGYRDNRDFALPILKRHNIPFAVYVPAHFADGRGKLWWLTLEEAIRRSQSIDVEIGGVRLQLPCGDAEEKQRAFDQIYWALRPLPDSEVHTIVDSLADCVGLDPMAFGRDLIMGWEELHEFAQDPLVTIGGHTLSHVSLAKLSEEDARFEIGESVRRLEDQLGQSCGHFSFPYGDVGSAGPREYSIARELGLRTAVTTAKGLVPSGEEFNLHAIPRLSLNGDFQDPDCVRALLSGVPFALFNWAKRALPRRSRAA